ncbi:6047_t:CDS:2, partial [Ambispora gerdemannii]
HSNSADSNHVSSSLQSNAVSRAREPAIRDPHQITNVITNIFGFIHPERSSFQTSVGASPPYSWKWWRGVSKDPIDDAKSLTCRSTPDQ